MQDKVVRTTIDRWLKSGLKSQQIREIVRERSIKLSQATKRVLYNKSYGGFNFSEEFRHLHGMTEDSDAVTERSNERTFETIELLGQGICTSTPYVCDDVELCQRLDLQKLGELVHKQRFREKSNNDIFEDDYRQCLKKLHAWPTDVLEAARAYYDTQGLGYWSLFLPHGGLFQYSTDCTFAEHVKLGKTLWPLHEAFRVSGIAGGCLIAASFREKSRVGSAVSVAAGQATESPQLILGLAAASGPHCALGYADVPELADYEIHENDGKEHVVW
ncbi:hypothetical protein ABBQ38_007636 [Trebouxia sp. C0009 RCD-2024]